MRIIIWRLQSPLIYGLRYLLATTIAEVQVTTIWEGWYFVVQMLFLITLFVSVRKLKALDVRKLDALQGCNGLLYCIATISWRTFVIFLCSIACFCHPESLGTRLQASGQLQAALLCFVVSGSLDSFVRCWVHMRESDGELSTQNLQVSYHRDS